MAYIRQSSEEVAVQPKLCQFFKIANLIWLWRVEILSSILTKNSLTLNTYQALYLIVAYVQSPQPTTFCNAPAKHDEK